MKWSTFIIIVLAAMAVVFGTLYFAHPRIKTVEKPIPQVSYLPSKPDTVYLERIKYVPVPYEVPGDSVSNVDTVYVLVPDTTQPETFISIKEFTRASLFGEIRSKVRSYGPTEAFALSDSVWFPEGEREAFERIKNEVAESNKPNSKFWPGVAVGAVVVAGMAITADRLFK